MVSPDFDLAVPLVLVYDQLAKPARATVKETYAQVKSDLDSAAVNLAKVPGSVRAQEADHRCRERPLCPILS